MKPGAMLKKIGAAPKSESGSDDITKTTKAYTKPGAKLKKFGGYK